MFIPTKKEYLLTTDSVCIAGLNKKRVKTTENNGIWSFEYWFGTCCVKLLYCTFIRSCFGKRS